MTDVKNSFYINNISIVILLFSFLFLTNFSTKSATQNIGQPGEFEEFIIMVTKTEDTRDGSCDEDCSLREAVDLANDMPGTETIVLSAGIYMLDIEDVEGDEDNNARGDLDIIEAVKIIGIDLGNTNSTKSAGTIIDGGAGTLENPSRIFDVDYGEFPMATFEIENVTLRNAWSAESGGALKLTGGGGFTAINVMFENNAAADSGGAICYLPETGVAGMKIIDSGFTGNSSGNNGGAVAADYETDLTPVAGLLARTTFEDNTAENNGGAVYITGGFADVDDSAFLNNTAGANGGGLYNVGYEGLTAIIDRTMSDGNTAGENGGAFYFLEIGGAVARSTVSNNMALNGVGGAIYYGTSDEDENTGSEGPYAVAQNGEISLENNTMSGNFAALDGSALWLDYGVGLLFHSTIVNNTTEATEGAAVCNEGAIPVGLKSTIIANNNGGTDCSGVSGFNSGGHNISSDTSCFNGSNQADMPSTDPVLGELANNGSEFQTHIPLPGSPAIDSADPENTNETDQRGITRDSMPDIGAVEFVDTESGSDSGCAVAPAEYSLPLPVYFLFPAIILIRILRRKNKVERGFN